MTRKYEGEFNPTEVESFWRNEMRPEWVVNEETKYKEAMELEHQKPKEEQEWYQKWLRRQENKNINWAADWKDDGEAIKPDERRYDKTDKTYYTFEEVKSKYTEFNDKEVESYWRKETVSLLYGSLRPSSWPWNCVPSPTSKSGGVVRSGEHNLLYGGKHNAMHGRPQHRDIQSNPAGYNRHYIR